jgi:crossover junction endodeoxyribonuclease RuvC
VIFAGIDTGVTGAIAMLDEAGALIAVHDLPIIRDGRLSWIDAPSLISLLIEQRAGKQMCATVERTHTMPRNGSQAAFSQGCTLGSVLATLQAASVSVTLVAPNTWKKAAGLIGQDKDTSLHRARLRWPTASLDRQKDHNRAEAILIAEHGRRDWLAIGQRLEATV